MDGGGYGGPGAWPYGGPPGLSPSVADRAAIPSDPPEARSRRGRRALIAVVAAATVAVVSVVAWPAASHGSTVRPRATPTAGQDGTDTAAAAATQRDLATTAILRNRSAALSRGDLTAWLADVDPDQPVLIAHQRMLFTNLRKLSLARFDWAPAPGSSTTSYSVPGYLSSAFVDDQNTYSRGYLLHYRFRGYDKSAVEDNYAPIFLLRHGRWLLAGDQTATKSDSHMDEPWDTAPIVVGTGRRSLVVISASDAKKLPQLVKQADAAVLRVASMWPGGWAHRAIFYDTRDVDVFATYLGTLTSSADYDGVTRGLGPAGSSRAEQDTRVVGNPTYVPPGSKEIPALLTHEFTHVAKWADSSAGTPLWATEGIAEYTAYRGHPQDQLLPNKIGKDGRAGRLPRTLPTSKSFYVGGVTTEYDYGMAWLAFEYISVTYGEPKVRLLYERLATITAPEDSAAALKAEGRAFQAVLHLSEPTFVSGLNRWIGRVIRPA
jgi:hypothetical protein